MVCAMAETAKVFEDGERPGHWHVEGLNGDSESEVAIFSGPNAHDRAIRYANSQYQSFQVVRLSP